MSLEARDNNRQCKLRETLLKTIVMQPKTREQFGSDAGGRLVNGDRERRETEPVRNSHGVEKNKNKNKHRLTSMETDGDRRSSGNSHRL